MATTTLLERRNATLGTGAPLFYQEPVHIVHGSGVELFDANGRRYLDMYNNVPCVGHCHPHVVEVSELLSPRHVDRHELTNKTPKQETKFSHHKLP